MSERNYRQLGVGLALEDPHTGTINRDQCNACQKPASVVVVTGKVNKHHLYLCGTCSALLIRGLLRGLTGEAEVEG